MGKVTHLRVTRVMLGEPRGEFLEKCASALSETLGYEVTPEEYLELHRSLQVLEGRPNPLQDEEE